MWYLYRWGAIGTELAPEVFPVYPHEKLIKGLGVVAETVVQIIIVDGSPCAERDLPVEVGKKIHLVVMVMLHNGQGVWSTIQWMRLVNWHIPPPMPLPVVPEAMTSPSR